MGLLLGGGRCAGTGGCSAFGPIPLVGGRPQSKAFDKSVKPYGQMLLFAPGGVAKMRAALALFTDAIHACHLEWGPASCTNTTKGWALLAADRIPPRMPCPADAKR